MKTASYRTWSALFVAGCLAWSSLASAAVFTYSVNIPAGDANWSTPVELPQFDPANGELQRVVIRISGAISGSLGVENMEDKFNLVFGTLAGQLLVQDASNATVLDLSLSQTGSTVLDPFDSELDYAGTSGYTFNNLGSSGSTLADYYVTFYDFSGYIGLGHVDYTVSLVDNSTASAGFGVPAFESFINGGATLEISYWTAVIPEPSNLATMGIVVAFCLAARRWQREQRLGTMAYVIRRGGRRT